MAEVTICDEPLAQDGCTLRGDENALWLTTKEGPECVPLDDMEFSDQRQNATLSPTQWSTQGFCQPTEAEGWWHSGSQVCGSPRPWRERLTGGDRAKHVRSRWQHLHQLHRERGAGLGDVVLGSSRRDDTHRIDVASTSVFAGPGVKLRITIRIWDRKFQRGVVCHADEHHGDGCRSCDVSERRQVNRVTGAMQKEKYASPTELGLGSAS